MRLIVQQHSPEPPTLGLPCLNSRISRFTLMTDTEHQCRLSGIEPAIQCDSVAGTPLRDDELAAVRPDQAPNQRMACEDLDRFAHLRDRRQGQGGIVSAMNSNIRSRSASPRGLDWTVAILGARTLGARVLGFGREIGKDLVRIIRFFRCAGLRPRPHGILKEFAERLCAFCLSCDGFHHERVGRPAASRESAAIPFFSSSGSLRLVTDILQAPARVIK